MQPEHNLTIGLSEEGDDVGPVLLLAEMVTVLCGSGWCWHGGWRCAWVVEVLHLRLVLLAGYFLHAHPGNADPDWVAAAASTGDPWLWLFLVALLRPLEEEPVDPWGCTNRF